MFKKITASVWQQWGAAIDMLHDAISTCPDDFFTTNKRFYYLAYHTVILLDYYLTIPPVSFTPVLPFTILPPGQRPLESVGDMIPDRIYSKAELLNYIRLTRLKCKKLIDGLVTGNALESRFTEGDQPGDMDYPVLEILLYNLRHTQHHVGQLYLIVRQDLNQHINWIFRADGDNGL